MTNKIQNPIVIINGEEVKVNPVSMSFDEFFLQRAKEIAPIKLPNKPIEEININNQRENKMNNELQVTLSDEEGNIKIETYSDASFYTNEYGDLIIKERKAAEKTGNIGIYKRDEWISCRTVFKNDNSVTLPPPNQGEIVTKG